MRFYPLRHTFVSILGEEEEDAILTKAARNEAAYASRMKNGGWSQCDMSFQSSSGHGIWNGEGVVAESRGLGIRGLTIRRFV